MGQMPIAPSMPITPSMGPMAPQLGLQRSEGCQTEPQIEHHTDAPTENQMECQTANQNEEEEAPAESQDVQTGDSCCKSMVHQDPRCLNKCLVGPQVPQLGPQGP